MPGSGAIGGYCCIASAAVIVSRLVMATDAAVPLSSTISVAVEARVKLRLNCESGRKLAAWLKLTSENNLLAFVSTDCRGVSDCGVPDNHLLY